MNEWFKKGVYYHGHISKVLHIYSFTGDPIIKWFNRKDDE